MKCYTNNNISIAKSIGIILMVIGHSGCPGWMFYFIYLFHMPLFFFLSGYCFKDQYVNNKKTFILKRIKTLYMPFVLYNILFILLHNLLFRIHIHATAYSWSDYINFIPKVLAMGFTEVNLGPYWFLRYLFLASILFLLIMFCLYNYSQYIKYIVMLLPIITIISHMNIFSWLPSYILFLSIFFYGSGYLMKNITINKSVWFWFGLFFIVAIGSVFIHSHMLMMDNKDIIPYCLFAIIGIIGVLSLSLCISSSSLLWIKKIMVYIGNHSLVILTWHFLVFDFISLFYLKIILKQPFTSVEPICLHSNLGGLHFIIYTILGIILPLLIHRLFKFENIKRIFHIG